ncbi:MULTISPECIES: trans-acting enoyl reductase family protein [unclassified Phenylobacterium]|uniref:saccharopine dehydrogenase family protein n=1 Tax=unclassified Phenylobacterium TaxID=2640670 RepID=UPI0022B4420A|nr:saccharopine dehydrogenase NADP-binding domain-containing protein [Phenylobacterium sp. NIBR 498073]MBS0490933.1 saccharopine dehydrogenase NADP-binding domain-containing protein [Pseudomonadota bacterium]WGU40518.1 saccharopine dehydrogenase NADP-binding domain-containing protein [Phenylobacterium sp. NIBR 498073]
MNSGAEFDIIVYGATGFTGRLVAEHLAGRYGVGGEVKWAMAGRSLEKLQQVRDEIGAPKDTPLIVADAGDPASVKAMVERAKAILTTVGPYQLYGSDLVAACVAAGTDYLDLCGEPNWMAAMIRQHHEAAQKSGARILFSCGFDSIPFELGVYFAQATARQKLGGVVPRVKGRMRQLKGGLSGGTAASGRATMAAIQKDPSLFALMVDPFALTPGFKGPEQPAGQAVEHDEDLNADVGPFMMAAINTKNVHRSNFLQGHAYGQDFVYDEMAVVDPKAPASFALEEGAGPQPGEGPSKEERETGFYDAAFIGIAADGRKVVVSVKGDKDPGYGSTSKMIAETAICLVKEAADVPGGLWVPGAALGDKLIARLQKNAGLKFEVEA